MVERKLQCFPPTYPTSSECGSSTCNALSLSEILSLRRCIEKQKVGELKAYKQVFMAANETNNPFRYLNGHSKSDALF